MEYSEYEQKKLAIYQEMNVLREEHQQQVKRYEQELLNLANSYLGLFAVGNAVKYRNEKYFIQEHYSIREGRAAVTIRKANKSGGPNANGIVHYYVDTNALEVWDEL